MELVSRGLTNDDIARVLRISPLTVRTHLTTILAQLEVANRTEATAHYVAWEARPTRASAVLQRPAIAVLPFVALAGGARGQNLAVGISHDLAALFSRWCWFPVIANSSTGVAGAPGASGAEVAIKLGARFLVEGSLRLQRARWRLVVRIDDALAGHCLWTESVEFPAAGVFAVQDEICQAMVAAAYPVLIERVHRREEERHPRSLEAWELSHEGMRLHAAREPNSNARAAELFAEALGRDRGLVVAHFGAGLAAYDEILNQWGPALAAGARLASAAERCLSLAPHAAEGFYLLARQALAAGDHARAVHPLEMAIARNPSFSHAHALLAQVLQVSGKSDEALTRMKHAVRLGPRSFVAGLAMLHFVRAEYADALQAAESAVATKPGYTFARAMAAASAWWLGDRERAAAHLRTLRAEHLSFEPRSFLSTFGGNEAVGRIFEALASL